MALCNPVSSVSIAWQLDPCSLGTRLEDNLWAKISPTYPVLGVMNDRCINVQLNMNADQLCSSYQRGVGQDHVHYEVKKYILI